MHIKFNCFRFSHQPKLCPHRVKKHELSLYISENTEPILPFDSCSHFEIDVFFKTNFDRVLSLEYVWRLSDNNEQCENGE